MFIEIVILAFTLQLIALPGEKGQFIISSLSMKYSPYSVVTGASLAFAGWTVVEIYVGSELKNAFPAEFLDGATVMLLILFAIILIYPRSKEFKNNKQKITEKIPTYFNGLIPSFIIMTVGEFGDKTQIITIALAVQYGATPAIWLGEMLAIIPFSLANALLFDRIGNRISTRKVRILSAVLFLLFALDIVVEYAFNISILPI